MRNLMLMRAENRLQPQRQWLVFVALGCLTGVSLDVVAAQTCSPNIAFTRPDSRYEFVTGTNPADSEVRDKVTGLIWQRCAQGMSWNGSTCTGIATAHSWTAALELARTATATTASPVTPWRVPNRAELLSLPERACHLPAINTSWFPQDPGNWVWSSSTISGFPDRAWTVSFDSGDDSYAIKSVTGVVRLVRSGQ